MPLFIETHRAKVGPTDCDHLGHMNAQHYFAAVSNGMFVRWAVWVLCPRKSSGGKCQLLLSMQTPIFTTSCVPEI
jgi:hypothetical protein